jgi:hypothetical protein
MNRERKLLFTAAALIALTPMCARSAPAQHHTRMPILLATGLEGSIGSTVGPDGALYVPEGVAGRISRINTETGEVTTFASGLPKSAAGVGGGAIDVAFLGDSAYALVTLVSPDVGGNDIDGIYRVDGPNSVTAIANIGRWSTAHPPKTAFELPTGVQYALETYRGGFLVSDGTTIAYCESKWLTVRVHRPRTTAISAS